MPSFVCLRSHLPPRLVGKARRACPTWFIDRWDPSTRSCGTAQDDKVGSVSIMGWVGGYHIVILSASEGTKNIVIYINKMLKCI
jgi:hypothetical protein